MIIRNLIEDEVRQLVRWAESEGWNPGVDDAALFWNLDPQGYLGIEIEDQMIGGGAIIKHNSMFGFMGLFIVDPEFRGKKLGTKLWFARRDRLLDRLDQNGTIGLDGVDDMVPFYEKGGFKQYTRHRRFELATPPSPSSAPTEVQELNELDFEKIQELDRQCFPGERAEYLKSWIHQAGHVSLGITDGTKVTGFGVMRPCQTGWKIGPLFADDISIADQLFLAFCQRAESKSVYLDAPDNNPAARELCERHQMEEVFGCVRMYLGPVPELANQKIFGITTLEVG
ncbi:GNAT family N-acetyltransferase [Planctomicrobium sp.]|nr:GNAT family N-acetyltransferase [Planctomicrobium sp.]MBT5017421.1 GNAT family N-acetyltransferase [Planctomicrobium sp.]MDB4743742.1 GNAT family N-acetyltransferase [Planctomicrobium sp.]